MGQKAGRDLFPPGLYKSQVIASASVRAEAISSDASHEIASVAKPPRNDVVARIYISLTRYRNLSVFQ